MIPKKNNCNPPIKIIIQARDGQPDTGSPNINVFIMIIKIKTKEMIQQIRPINADNTNGFVENANIPSRAYLNNFQKLNFEVPATLSLVSNFIHLVLNPTKLNIPLV